MGDIDRIEATRPGTTFEFVHEGQLIAVPGPEHLSYQQILAILNDPRHLATQVEIPTWKREAARDAWAAHHDLPDFIHAQRLCYLVDRYSAAITYDLRAYAHSDMHELWRSRRWRTLLNLIDNLPGHTAYALVVSKDDEHTKMLADAVKAKGADLEPDKGPSVYGWSPEIDAITSLRDDVRALGYILRAANGDKSARPPKPLPRPVSPMQAAIRASEHERRKATHESLVARMLPNKRRS